jgi:UDP-N-acetylglucosamine transferase subunit ALG13
MIFVTIGTQVPFDRMIRAIDEIAGSLPGKEFVVQALETKYRPKHIEVLDYIAPGDFKNYIEAAELIISHAGTGTILSVSQLEKPLIVFPRSGKLKETRNDHQFATCRMLERTSGLQVAYDEKQLREKVEVFLRGALPVMRKMPQFASEQLIGSIRSFIEPGNNFVTPSQVRQPARY